MLVLTSKSSEPEEEKSWSSKTEARLGLELALEGCETLVGEVESEELLTHRGGVKRLNKVEAELVEVVLAVFERRAAAKCRKSEARRGRLTRRSRPL